MYYFNQAPESRSTFKTQSCVNKLDALDTYEKMEAQLHSFSTTAVMDVNTKLHSLASSVPGKEAPVSNCLRGPRFVCTKEV